MQPGCEHQLNCLSQDRQCLSGFSPPPLVLGSVGNLTAVHILVIEMLMARAVTIMPLTGAGFVCQAAPGDSITDCLHSLPGAPRALPLRPVLNGYQQEEKLTKDRRPDFGGRGQGVPLDCRPHRTDPWLRPLPPNHGRRGRKRLALSELSMHV